MLTRCAVLGSPVAHSLSPVLHRAAYRELGLAWEYDAIEVTEEELPDFLDGLRPPWRGLSLTMPLKRAVLPLLDEVSETARAAGAANTLLLDVHGRRTGENTDVPGMVSALEERGVSRVATAVVVGGGATATSAVLALSRMGCHSVTLWVREPARARETLEAAARVTGAPSVQVAGAETPVEDQGEVDLVLSTIPASAQEPVAVGLAERAAAVFDVLYDPWPTPLARAATSAHRPLVSGLDLLLHQATRQVELMTGCDTAPLEAMRSAGRAALAGRGAG
ncbi:MAG: shikimate dehydrogenase [Nocardioidaceae bacterium]